MVATVGDLADGSDEVGTVVGGRFQIRGLQWIGLDSRRRWMTDKHPSVTKDESKLCRSSL